MNGDLTPLYNNRSHIDAFKEIVYHQLDRVYGLDREQAEPELEPEMELDLKMALEPELEVADREIPFHDVARVEDGT